MSAPDRSAPIDIPKPRQGAAGRDRNRGQHTSDFIDPNLMQLNPNHQTISTASIKLANNDKGKADQATRAMPPPPVPSQSSQPPVSAIATGPMVDYDQLDPNYEAFSARQEALLARQRQLQRKDLVKKSVHFNDDLTKALAEAQEDRVSPRTLINDKPVPQSIAMLGHNKKVHTSRPNVYQSSYNVAGRLLHRVTSSLASTTSAADQEGMTVYDNGIKTQPVDDQGEWIDIEQLDEKDEVAEAEKQYVKVDHPGLGGKHRGSSGVAAVGHGRGRDRRSAAAAAAPGGFGLAEDYYVGRTAEQKKRIDPERDGLVRSAE